MSFYDKSYYWIPGYWRRELRFTLSEILMEDTPDGEIYYTLASTTLYTGFTLSVCPSVRLSVCGQNRVRSGSSTILVGSISYLHILSSNFRRCVACNACFKIFGEFFKFVILTLSSSDLGSNMTQWNGWSWGGEGYPQNAGVLVFFYLLRPSDAYMRL